ncbi:MAG TPA: DUF6644 family protein [Burkholderiales bacterium]
MDIDTLLRTLEETSIATLIRENESLFPWVESFHVLAITLVIGSIAIVDLRLIGLASRERPAGRLASEVLRCTWTAFAVAAITGALLFASNAFNYAHNSYFQAKLLFLVLAALNMSVFHLFAGRDIERWGIPDQKNPLPARIAGAVSLFLWIGVVAFGRWVGFSLHPTPLAG